MKTIQEKTWRDIWRQAGEYKMLPDFPLHLDIELSGRCNLKCKFCFQNDLITGGLGLMDMSLYQKIVDEAVLNNVQSIKLQVRGESLLHPQLCDCIRYAKKWGIPNVQITTNGILLNDQMMTEIINSGLDRITFSVDAQHAPNKDIIQQFLDCRDASNNSHPRVRIHSVIPILNASLIGRVKVILRKEFPRTDVISVTRLFEFENDSDAYPDLKANYTLLPCGLLMRQLAIFWNGEVTTCCMDYNNRFKLGNATDESLQNIWFSSWLQVLRYAHKNGLREAIAICVHCHAFTDSKHSVNFVPELFW